MTAGFWYLVFGLVQGQRVGALIPTAGLWRVWVESRRIAFVKVGRHVRFRECDLVTVMQAWTIQPVNRSR
jgi:hypothetical protein